MSQTFQIELPRDKNPSEEEWIKICNEYFGPTHEAKVDGYDENGVLKIRIVKKEEQN